MNYTYIKNYWFIYHTITKMESDFEIMNEYANKNDENILEYRNTLKIEINKLVLEQWSFLSKDWKKIENKYKHRTEIKNVKEIREIKDKLFNKLGYISVFFFITILYTNKEYPGPYLEIEKALLLLYHLTEGLTAKTLVTHMPYTTFYALYKEFWITNYNNMNKYVDSCLMNMFSNLKIRILSAKIKNPKNFKNITLMLDGHDSAIAYDKPDISKLKKWSYKLKSSGIRTQVLIDINENVISVSESLLCGVSSDGGMMLNMKLYNKIKDQDCVAIDGGYTLFIKQFETLCINKKSNLNDKNFFYPIRKENGINLNTQEEHYNKVFGSFRSTVENQFKDLYNKFKRFSNNNSILKTDDIKYINLQLKVVFLLKNIYNFSDKFNIIVQEHHKLWFNDSFEFPSNMRLIDIVYTNQMEQLQKLKELNQLQDEFIKLNIDDNNSNMIIDNEIIEDDTIDDKNNDDVDFPEYRSISKKRRKKSKNNKTNNLNIYELRNINEDENIYEIDKIIDHKIENKRYIFLVKWVGYNESSNSWVKENDFTQKEIIIEYFSDKKIIYNSQ